MVYHEKETISRDKKRLHSSRQEAGKSVKDMASEHGISKATFYNWGAKYGGMEISDVRKMKELEGENARLKRTVTNLNCSRPHESLGFVPPVDYKGSVFLELLETRKL